MVERWADLHHVHAQDGQLVADPPHRIEQLPGAEPARFRGAGARGVARVADVDVDAEEDAVTLIEGDCEGLGEAFLQTPGHDLGHLVGAHVLLGHPLEDLRRWPIPAQPDLQEAVAASRTGFNEPAHGLAVADQGAELNVAGVGVGVEVNHRHTAPAIPPTCHPGDVRPGDGVVPTQDQRNGTAGSDPLDGRFEVRAGPGGIPGEHFDVTRIDHTQILQSVHSHRQRGPRAVMGEVAGLSQRLGAESGP